jgi:NAD(P)H-dependent FMN reductase
LTLDDDANPSDAVKRLKSDIQSAQGILFVTAEYNRSIPGRNIYYPRFTGVYYS